jgi:hypothetical protein
MWKGFKVFWFFVAACLLSSLSNDVSVVDGFDVKGDAAKSYYPIYNISTLRGGAALNPFPSGYNPMGYGLTDLGKQFLGFDGSLDCDVGRFLASLKSGKRKSKSVMKEQWLEVVRVSKQGQSMRVYRQLDELIAFCLKAGFID